MSQPGTAPRTGRFRWFLAGAALATAILLLLFFGTGGPGVDPGGVPSSELQGPVAVVKEVEEETARSHPPRDRHIPVRPSPSIPAPKVELSAPAIPATELAGPDSLSARDPLKKDERKELKEDLADGLLMTIATSAGVIEGTVVFDGEPPERRALDRASDPVCAKEPALDESLLVSERRVQNAFVRIKEPIAVEATSAPLVIELADCAFRPRVAAVLRSQSSRLRNSDGTLHNPHLYLAHKTLRNVAMPPGSRELDLLTEQRMSVLGMSTLPLLLTLKCDVHPWEQAFVHVVPHPFFDVTDSEGRFRIAAVPPGSYTLEVWHERLGTKLTRIAIGPEPAYVSVAFTPSDRR